MSNYRIQFQKIDREEDFVHFAGQIDGQVTDGHVMNLSGSIARGVIRKFHLDVGLHMRAWDMVVNTPVTLIKEAIPVLVNNSTFSLFYVMTPGSLVLEAIGEHHQFGKIMNRSALFVSDDLSASFRLRPFQPIQFIDLSIGTYWLLQQMKNTDSLPDSLNHFLLKAHAPQIMLDDCSTQTNLAVTKLFINAMQKEKDEATRNSLSSFLVTDLLYRHCTKEQKGMNARKELYYDKIVEVEAIIMEHLQSSLPALPVIAQQVGLSESTLKRYFKSKFGRSIYEYYLEKKMILAKHIMLHNTLTVNETAGMMGYEKVSNFIDIFKKHHGHSPGSIKKRSFSAG
jgi:AraC-like DNA-binding protein